VWHHFQIASIQGCKICKKEDPEQVDSENKDMEESIRIMVNMFNYMCGTIFKMPASRDVKFLKKKTQKFRKLGLLEGSFFQISFWAVQMFPDHPGG
jgi:hypothetical protein